MKLQVGTFFFLLLSTLAHASGSIYVECQGTGAAPDRYIYDARLHATLDETQGSFTLTADGHGPGNRYDIGNRFQKVPYRFQIEKDEKGRALETRISGKALPGDRTLDLKLDLSRANSKAELEFMRSDGNLVFAALSCKTVLPQVCTKYRKCTKHCHPMSGCDQFCRDEYVCGRPNFPNQD